MSDLIPLAYSENGGSPVVLNKDSGEPLCSLAGIDCQSITAMKLLRTLNGEHKVIPVFEAGIVGYARRAGLDEETLTKLTAMYGNDEYELYDAIRQELDDRANNVKPDPNQPIDDLLDL